MTNSADTRIGVGLVGASADRGWGGIAHVPALQALDAFQIRAVSTTRMESANATARRLGAGLAFDTHEALVVRPEVDLVVVAVKVPDHKQIVSDALAAGKMVYCEWPLARNLSEAEALEGFARERRLRTVVGLQGGLHPPVLFLRDLVAQGVIGKPLSTSIRAHLTDDMWAGRYDPPVEYMADAKHGATLLSIMLGHGLEPLARVLGTFESLSAVVANQRGDGVRLSDGASLPKDAPDEIVVAGVLEGGIVTSLHYSAGRSAGSAMVWEIQGTEGSVRVESASGYIHFTDFTITLCRGSEPAQVLPVPPAYAAPDLQLDAPAAGVARLYAQFAADLRDGTAVAPDFAVALYRHRVLDAITRAAETGHRQHLSRPDRMNSSPCTRARH
ncbi:MULTISPECIES: Gfo/Idh/MocA family protein [Streptomyces]|uniref:Gfo/Idh/MocA family protein n=1 Tax=Streptomyces TaxID=1883 RepID=UPI0003A09B54|nr:MULTISPECIES: Gfo/Idh/MocA family oxidoreductase [Streptomyces]MBZ6110907.1 Gfo/Idh/MocA family oxidoreductase [Streptomyces olivaceus]MBZ6126274.1 Gfo/Idh/MocA family oxidoreductase [Streptomyces olivaceus]MBZ6145244.1 Gfo/Idh/MocA family oxidoreductase [Streptomyces olivaceus]MBZ6159750.1 Gfo/Idh/MocA family oxidoreductase [Streptomyces olivaceus]MBZ6187529.1 Gfo/Idh/MocA family oxidoreductase [Streptomyces olivaceus]